MFLTTIRRRVGRAMLRTVPVLALVGGALAAAGGSAAAAPADRTVTYLGYRFTVPASWAVVDLTASPASCVRFDTHAIYLGTPAADQPCPARLIGRTEALMVQPANTSVSSVSISNNAVEQEVSATAPGIKATGSYRDDPALVDAILQEALPAAKRVASAPAAAAAPVPLSVMVAAGATNYTGLGFDPCEAPSSGTMSAWASSPYRAIGVYFGGGNRTCKDQPNLTASWVAAQASAGWRFFPLYVGVQAPGTSCHTCSVMTSPVTEGIKAADDAAGRAAALGFPSGSTLYYDMEDYGSHSASALSFESAWTTELHAKGYTSGIYSSLSSGITDLVNNAGSYTMPDVIDFAAWPGSGASTSSSSIPASMWANHQRIHQYQGGHNETYGGVSINIDTDYLDVQLASSAKRPPLPDFSGDGVADLVGVSADGLMQYYPNNSGSNANHVPFAGSGLPVGTGWNAYTRLYAADFSGDGVEDLIAVTADGHMQYYPNNSGSNTNHVPFAGNGVSVGEGWNAYARLYAADFSGDGTADLIAVTTDGHMQYYPNNGASNTNHVPFAGSGLPDGEGWNTYTNLYT